jgi:hypothetical protein
MKRIACVIILAVFGMISCKSAPKDIPVPVPKEEPIPTPKEEPVPAPKEEVVPAPKEEPVNVVVEKVFNQYRSGLILTGAKQYTVQSSDTLSRLANREFGAGNGYYFPVIMLASSEDAVIQDPDVIEPGMHLTIPVLKTNLDDANARANIKAYLKDISEVYARKYAETGKADYNVTKTRLVELSNTL